MAKWKKKRAYVFKKNGEEYNFETNREYEFWIAGMAFARKIAELEFSEKLNGKSKVFWVGRSQIPITKDNWPYNFSLGRTGYLGSLARKELDEFFNLKISTNDGRVKVKVTMERVEK